MHLRMHLKERKNMSHLESQADFHRAVGQPVQKRPTLPEKTLESIETRSALMQVELSIRKAQQALQADQGRRPLRIALLLEEVGVLLEAERRDNLHGIADALADIEVIADGTALEYGIPLDDIRAEVHRANMSKLGPDGPIFREDGKVLKGPDYLPPDISGILRANGYNPAGDP